MKIEVKIEKKHLVALAILGVLLLAGIFAYAYGTNTPQVFGHSGGEVEISLPDGTITNLQQAITNNLIGGGGLIRYNLSVFNLSTRGYPEGYVIRCPNKTIMLRAIDIGYGNNKGINVDYDAQTCSAYENDDNYGGFGCLIYCLNLSTA